MFGSPFALDQNDDQSPASSITIWLDHHPDHPEQYFCDNQSKPYQADTNLSRLSRQAWPESPNKRRRLGDLSGHSMNARSQRARRTSPRKEARDLQENHVPAPQEIEKDGDMMEERGAAPSTPPAAPAVWPLDQDTTPKPLSLSSMPYPNLPHATSERPKPSKSLTEASSPSRSTASSSRTTSTRSAPRARSPVKRIGDFNLSSVPITLYEFNTPDHPTPNAAKALVRDLRRISAGRGIIPHTIKERAMPYLEDIIFDDLCFTKADPATSDDDDATAAAQHDTLWRQVLDVLDAARECRTQQLPEASWNAEVHSRLLRSALAGPWRARGIWYRDITTSKISDASLLPSAGGGASAAVMGGKMVDYALIIEPDARLGRCIRETLRSEGARAINATSAEHVRFAPVAVGLETKRAAVDEDEGCVQLGLWAAAHFARLSQLVRHRRICGADDGLGIAGEQPAGCEDLGLPALPLVMCQGHDWKMMVAEAAVEPDAEDFRVLILRDLRLGSTDSVLGIYQLVEAVRRLARWVDEEYRPWLEREALLGVEEF